MATLPTGRQSRVATQKPATGPRQDAGSKGFGNGASPLGSARPWNLGVCDHGTTAGSGLADAGVAVPLVVFSLADGDMSIEIRPDESR